MKIRIDRKIKSKNGILVVPVFKEDFKKSPKNWGVEITNFVKARAKIDKFDGMRGVTFATYSKTKPNLKLVLMGFGKKEKFKSTIARELGGKIGKHIKCMKPKELTILMPETASPFTTELFEGFLMSLYVYDKFKTKKTKKQSKFELNNLIFVTEKKLKGVEDDIKKAQLICQAVDYVKNLVNLPSNHVDGDYLENEAKKLAKENKYKLEIIGKEALEKAGWGGLLAVGQGCKKDPRTLVLEYNGAGNEKPAVLVGKGIVFDSGGYNLKPSNHIEDMHQDMAGGAVILGLFTVLKKLGIKKNIVGIIPMTENLINEKAYRPSDVIKTLSGMTVEITDTDAEGRLILADAITYSKKFKPEHLVTIATLTGAVAVALGDRYAGILGNSGEICKKIRKAGILTDELTWPLPIHRDFSKKMKSEIADLRNFDRGGNSRLAGCSKAAAFLKFFVGKTPWCHIDIGGTAYTSDPKEYENKGATAFGVRLLLKFLEGRD